MQVLLSPEFGCQLDTLYFVASWTGVPSTSAVPTRPLSKKPGHRMGTSVYNSMNSSATCLERTGGKKTHKPQSLYEGSDITKAMNQVNFNQDTFS